MIRTLVLLSCTVLGACSHTAMEAARQDNRLIEQIARANMAEIAAGNLAVTKAYAPVLRQLGERIAEDHGNLLRAASGLAASRGTSVPATPGAAHQPALKRLESLADASFDRAFMEHTVKQHQRTLQLLQQAASQAGDPQLRAHAQSAIPHIERQLATAQRLAF
jgi:putative membrane protein